MVETSFTLVPKKERPKRDLWSDLGYFFLLLLFFGLLFSYLFFEYSRYVLDKRASEIQSAINSETSGELKRLEEEISYYKDLFSALEGLSPQEQNLRDLFAFLEDNLHPLLTVSDVELDPISKTIKIKGSAPGFFIVAQQVRYLEEKTPADVLVKSVGTEEGKGVVLELLLTLPGNDKE